MIASTVTRGNHDEWVQSRALGTRRARIYRHESIYGASEGCLDVTRTALRRTNRDLAARSSMNRPLRDLAGSVTDMVTTSVSLHVDHHSGPNDGQRERLEPANRHLLPLPVPRTWVVRVPTGTPQR